MKPHTIHDRFYYHVPGGESVGVWMGLLWNYRRFRKRCPLLTLTSFHWWVMVWGDYQKGFNTCGCGRSWWTYRLLPALAGDGRMGGGC